MNPAIHIPGPAAKSMAFKILTAVAAAGGSADTVSLMRVLPANYRSSARLSDCAIQPLSRYGLVTAINGRVALTINGRLYLLQEGVKCVQVPETDSIEVAKPRTNPPFRKLNLSKVMAGRPIRPGMDDYASAPSMAGSTRIPYRR